MDQEILRLLKDAEKEGAHCCLGLYKVRYTIAALEQAQEDRKAVRGLAKQLDNLIHNWVVLGGGHKDWLHDGKKALTTHAEAIKRSEKDE